MVSAAKILVVDDEESIRFSLQEILTRDGYQVEVAESGKIALGLIQTQTFDLALLDLRLPDIGGMEVLAVLRQESPDTVAIVLTGHASLETAVEALRHGAHDYLFKPCKTVELRQSVRQGLLDRQQELEQRRLLHQLEDHLAATLKDIRATIVREPEPPTVDERSKEEVSEQQDRFLQREGLIVDFHRHVITLDGHLLELSPTEFNLLAYLIGEAPRVVSPQELVHEVQGYKSEQWEASETVRYHVYRLRQKIKAAANRTEVIRTIRGVGYTVGE